MITAVDESAKPSAAISAVCHGKPNSTPTPVSSAAHASDVRGAQPENVLAQRPQFRRAHFEADQKEEHDHAEFGDVQDRLGIVDDAQSIGADREAGREVAKHRAQPEPQEDRRGDHARGQQRHGVLQAPIRRRPQLQPPCVAFSMSKRPDVAPL